MQSSPLSLRRAIIWISRLRPRRHLPTYAGYSKAFLPKHEPVAFFLSKIFRIHEPLELRSPGSGVQDARLGYNSSPTRCPLRNHPGALLLIGWRLRIWASPYAPHARVFVAVFARHVLHMDINCGCFATPEPINLRKVLEDAALSGLALVMTILLYGSSSASPVDSRRKAGLASLRKDCVDWESVPFMKTLSEYLGWRCGARASLCRAGSWSAAGDARAARARHR
jgi:hypothetical protein